MGSLEELRTYFKKDYFAQSLGIAIDAATTQQAECSADIGETHKNALGYVQGGFLYSLCDFTVAVAANAEGGGFVTLDSNIHYLRSVQQGRLRAVATQVNASKQFRLYDVAVYAQDGKRLLAGSMTCYGRGDETPQK